MIVYARRSAQSEALEGGAGSVTCAFLICERRPAAPSPAGGPSAAKAVQAASPGAGGGTRPSGSPDFQQMLKRMPAVTLSDLQNGDAVMIVTTQGTANTQPTAITLLSGVEPILSASPNGNRAAMLLSPWNLGAGGEAAAGANQ